MKQEVEREMKFRGPEDFEYVVVQELEPRSYPEDDLITPGEFDIA